jgi:hypothetical protein
LQREYLPGRGGEAPFWNFHLWITKAVGMCRLVKKHEKKVFLRN